MWGRWVLLAIYVILTIVSIMDIRHYIRGYTYEINEITIYWIIITVVGLLAVIIAYF